jgi:heme/copper-type cytochrome/quinol oxidase subunit 1
MLPAKLFAALAALFAILAGLARVVPSPSIDLYVHATYFVLGPMLVLMFCVVSSVNFAVLYYAGHRIFHVRWNRPLTLLHFVLFLYFAMSFSLLFAFSTRAANGGPPTGTMDWIIISGFLGIFSLIVSFVVFAINLTTAVVQLARARTVSR